MAGVLEAAPAAALHWRPTRQFINPERYLDAHREGGASRFFAGSFNVRFFNISNSPGDMVMDTLGLAALGLTDLQCHYITAVWIPAGWRRYSPTPPTTSSSRGT